ncbi:MAG: FAD-binding protein [Kofleriaceae bacterium]|nr:FAD-binding protein [Kofleriaceae bacterium]
MQTRSPTGQVDLLQLVASQRPELRAVGSRTSKSPCFKTEGCEIDLAAFSEMEHLGDGRVRVGAGVILDDLLTYLALHKLALPNIGEWAGQTIAGVISTGTHGGSYEHASVCAAVTKLSLIDGMGELRIFERGDPGFDLLLPSFGCTGILVEFELLCPPIFNLALGRRWLDFEDYISELITNPEHVEFRSSIWLPAAGKVLDYSAKRVESTAGYENHREPRFNDTAMVFDWISRQPSKWSNRGIFAGGSLIANLTQSLTQPLSLLFPDKQYLGSYLDILAPLRGSAADILAKRARNRTPPEGEFAVSYANAPRLLRHLDKLFRVQGLAPDRPIGLRPGAKENGALSATLDGPCVWVSMFIYADNPFMRLLPDILVEFEARPHWGKCVFHRPSDIPALYPRWNEFCEFRKSLDPEGRFINKFAADFGIE